jgi:23S rRNA pseudouridine1911/1915/1917 synthase
VQKKFEFQIEERFHRKRVDEFLFNKFDSLSKMYLRDVIKAEKCEVNGFTANSGVVLKTNDFVEIHVDLERETAMRPQQMPLEIVFEDQHIVIINKPSGLLVHPTHREKNGTLLNGLAYYLNQEKLDYEVIRPGLVHRLDKQTSGLLVVTKTQRSLKTLTNHFKRKLVRKRYLALVEGVVEENEGKIVAPIGRFAEEKIWIVKEDGKHAETRFWVNERLFDKTLLELEPVTGRTNQLRIHCAHVGHPIVGDVKYGAKEHMRLCLHAFRLGFHHPNSNVWTEFEIGLPEEIKVFSK